MGWFGLIYIIKFGLIKSVNPMGWLMGWFENIYNGPRQGIIGVTYKQNIPGHQVQTGMGWTITMAGADKTISLMTFDYLSKDI